MKRIVVGLMSGTSADGVDAVVCRVEGRGLNMRTSVICHVHCAYPAGLREAVIAAGAGESFPAEAFLRLDLRLGDVYADAAGRAIRRAGLAPADVDLIGLHGQTICHLPPQSKGRAAAAGTWQIGDPAVIAARWGVPVVARFRQADMAVGGQGAPLVPWTDYVLFHDARRTRAIQNVGGIANVTFLPAGGGVDDVRAFDTGPGNMVMDGLVSALTQGRLRYDAGGRLAGRGRVCEELLREWLGHPYFARRPPKSCGREEFGAAFWRGGLSRYRRSLSVEDFLATATMLTARTIADAYGRFFDATARRTRPLARIFHSHRSAVPSRGDALPSRDREGAVPSSSRADTGNDDRTHRHAEMRRRSGGGRSCTAPLRSRLGKTRGEFAVVDEVVLCGGGALNGTLRRMLAATLPGTRVRRIDEFGIAVQAKEALSFAMLACACMDGVPANLPAVTGARRAVVLGQVVPGQVVPVSR